MRNLSVRGDVASYFATAKRLPALSREEEAELVLRWQTSGDRAAANSLARAHQRLVLTIALKYRHSGIPLGDLVAEGNVGVVHALAKFQAERGVRFGTYAAYWIRAQMLSCMVKTFSAVGGSGGMGSRIFFKLRRERARVATQLGTGEAAERELARRVGLSIERLRSLIQRLDSRDVGLDPSELNEWSGPLERLLAPDDQERELAAHQLRKPLQDAVARAMALLDVRERYIVDQRLMADDCDELSLAEIARRLRISRERARQLESRAKGKLRRFVASGTNPVMQEWLSHEVA